MIKTFENCKVPAVLLFVFALVGSATAIAQKAAGGKPNVQITLSAAIVRKGANVPVEKAGMLLPGEAINWTITSANEGSSHAANYSVVGQVPNGTSFVENSASANGANVTYSIDGGKSFSPKPTVEVRQSDGSTRKVAAPITSYTQVRYQWSDPLVAGQKVAAFYQVRVR